MTPEEAIRQIKYRLDLCEYSAPSEMMKESSLWTRAFIELASGRSDQGQYSLYDLYAYGWHEDDGTVLDFFLNTLDDHAKIEVLTFYTNYIHELSHHIDMIATPFGVNYHGKLFREYLNFQSFGREILKNPQLIAPWIRVVDYETNVIAKLEKNEQERLREAWYALKGQLYYFDAVFDTSSWGKRNAIRGWNHNTDPVMVLGKKFEKLTVRDFFLTIKISEDNKYLTPIAILESRALINCIQWIYWTMGNIAACKDAILVYLSEIYQNTIPEYTFVVNLFAQYYGYRDLQHFIENHPLRDLEHLLIMINACCWYALQAPPPMNEYSLHNSNPIARILLCINAVQDCIEREDAFAHIPQFLDSVDRSQSALNLFFQPIRSILDYCLKYLRYLKQKNSELKNNEQIKQHFGRIMDAQINQITKRQESEFPYASFSGLAESGNPMLGIEADEMDALLLDYIPDEKVKTWFNDRDQLLFKVQSRTHTIDLLEKWFHPSAFT